MMKLWIKGQIAKERLLRELKREEGMGTIEIAIIILVLIGIAILFRNTIETYVVDLLEKVTGQEVKVINGTN